MTALKIEDHVSLLTAALKAQKGDAVVVTREDLQAAVEVLSRGKTEYAVQTYRKDDGEALSIREDTWTHWEFQVREDFDREQFINRGSSYGVRIVKRTKFGGPIEFVAVGDFDV